MTAQDEKRATGFSTPGRPFDWQLPVRLVAGLFLCVSWAPLLLAAMRSAAPASTWEVAAAGLGLTGLAAMSMQVLTSGRFQTVSGRIGIDRVMAFHKSAAWWVLSMLLLHPVFYVVPTIIADPGLGLERGLAYLTLEQYRTGVIALCALLLLVLGSALRHRLPLPYEIWRAAHLLLAVIAIGLGLHHALSVGRFSAMGALNLYWWAIGTMVTAAILTLYGWRWGRLVARPWRVESVRKRADRLWEIDIQPAPGTPTLAYRAGQFVWITAGGRRFPLFDHPFSIADSPARPGLSLIIKEVGDFTRDIGRLSPGTPIGIDGPYGTFTLDRHHADAVVLIAGGAGIAPIMGLLRDLYANHDPRPIRLAYAVGNVQNLACADEIKAIASKLDLKTLLLSETPGPDFSGETGRLDPERLAMLLDGLVPAATVAAICGPGPMVSAVTDDLITLGVLMDRILYERFDYSDSASRLDRRMQRRFRVLAAGLLIGLLVFSILGG